MSSAVAPDSRFPRLGAAAAILLVPLAYFWLVGRYGWSDTDDGFVLGSAWRVFQGQLPYRDFIDIRPPTSAYLHSLWFRAADPRYVFAAARLGAITEMWAYSLAAAWALAGVRGRAAASEVLPLALAGFLLSATAFTPMPWHTTDGLVFSALGAALLVRSDRPVVVVTAAGLVLVGMGAKQSFYPAAPLALAFLAAERRFRSAGLFAGATAVGVAAFAAWLASRGALGEFLTQTTARTGGGYVFAAGVSSYLDMGLPFAAEGLAAIAAAWVLVRLARQRFRRGHAAVAVGLVVVTEYLRRLGGHAWVNASTLGYPHALFLAAAGLALVRAARPASRREGLAGLLFLGLAWCASLSIGFPTPLLFAAPLVAIPLLRPGGPADRDHPPRPVWLWAVAALAGAMAALAALYPYEERDPRAAEHCPLSSVEPKLALIVSGPRTCAKLGEYQALRRAHPGPFLTLPAFATAHAFAGDLDPVAADWPTLAEDAGRSVQLAGEADAQVRYAFVEADEAAQAAGDQRMPVLEHIRAAWRPVARGQVYVVYENPAWRPAPSGPLFGKTPE